MASTLQPYDRQAAVDYAHRWAYGRNPDFYNYETIGGDCTNFVSQCIYAGSGVMNYTPTFGWYYIDANNKAPAWTGVSYFYNFMTRDETSFGPIAIETGIFSMEPGDVIQLSFDGKTFQHTPIVVAVLGSFPTPGRILTASHSYDADYRPLSSYDYKKIRYLHFLGVNRT